VDYLEWTNYSFEMSLKFSSNNRIQKFVNYGHKSLKRKLQLPHANFNPIVLQICIAFSLCDVDPFTCLCPHKEDSHSKVALGKRKDKNETINEPLQVL